MVICVTIPCVIVLRNQVLTAWEYKPLYVFTPPADVRLPLDGPMRRDDASLSPYTYAGRAINNTMAIAFSHACKVQR